jgi:hypothetical protein
MYPKKYISLPGGVGTIRRPIYQRQTPHAASGWRIHCGVEVTELSTNKQHTLSRHPDVHSICIRTRKQQHDVEQQLFQHAKANPTLYIRPAAGDMCVCVCVCLCVCVCMRTYVHTYIRMTYMLIIYIYAYICILFVTIYRHLYVCICMHIV